MKTEPSHWNTNLFWKKKNLNALQGKVDFEYNFRYILILLENGSMIFKFYFVKF